MELAWCLYGAAALAALAPDAVRVRHPHLVHATIADLAVATGVLEAGLLVRRDDGTVTRIDVNASFMGVVFSPDGSTVAFSQYWNGTTWLDSTEVNTFTSSGIAGV